MRFRPRCATVLLSFVVVVCMQCSKQSATARFTYLSADGIGSVGSIAFHVEEEELDIFIEAFPTSGTDLDPGGITDADIIIASNHGHMTHYDAETVAMVQKNTGAFVVGNDRVGSDMLGQGVPMERIVVLSPEGLGETDSVTVLGVKITALRLTHSFVESIALDGFLVELPSGVRFFHGACSSAASVSQYLIDRPEFYDLDIMMLDYEHDFEVVHREFRPKQMVKHHETTGATWWPDYPEAPTVLKHGDSFTLGAR